MTLLYSPRVQSPRVAPAPLPLCSTRGDCAVVASWSVDSVPPPAPGACETLVRTLTYEYNRRDTAINALVLCLCVATASTATAVGSLALGTFFWLPLVVLVTSLQCIVTALTEQQGFSLIWAVIFGLMVFEQLRWRVVTAAGLACIVLGVATVVCASLAVGYYLIDELFFFEVPPLGHMRGARYGVTLCWFRTGTTVLHLLSMLLGASLGAAADAEDGRSSPFWSIFGLACSHRSRCRVCCSTGEGSTKDATAWPSNLRRWAAACGQPQRAHHRWRCWRSLLWRRNCSGHAMSSAGCNSR